MTRRNFFQTSAAGAAAASAQTDSGVPWFRRACRWGQTNITERDPVRYDIPWWREYWKRTRIQGVIINAGGIVAYYPSKFPLHHRAEFLNGRDLYGELARAAHEDGLAVLARMDCSRTAEDFFHAHPDWFARQASGEPYRTGDKYTTCVNSLYYDEYIPSVLVEIIERSHPEGFGDNSWSGLGRNSICHCDNCARKFRAAAGKPLPAAKDWNDAVYRQWIQWNYARRLEIWDLFNRTTKAAGGPNCLYVGMNSGSITSQSQSFRDFLEIGKRAEFLLLDHQARADETGFQQNGDTGKLVHGLLGWDKLMPESMALYQAGRPTFRLSAKPAPESRMWMIEGIAGGIQPWWHHVGAYHEDRRAYHTAEPVFAWHQQHERYLVERQPVAAIGVVWSQRNTDYFGRDEAAELVDAPYRGVTQALIRARIPYLPVNAEHIARDASHFSALVLPSVAVLSDAQCAAVRRFVADGGGLVATGATSLYDEWGDARKDFALADLFGAHAPSADFGRTVVRASVHSYLRISTPHHAVLRGFEETEILPFGGALENLRTDPTVTIPLTFVRPFPTNPPETAWMREPKTDIPGLILSTHGNARVAYLPADLDRRFGRDNLPDHGNLLANLFRWAAADRIPLEVSGAGLIDCHLYRQPGRLILHLVNLTNEGTWRAALDELVPVGALAVRVKLPDDVKGRSLEFLVGKGRAGVAVRQGWLSFEVKSVLDHEVVVVS
ncbi:MAG TPA: alpha-amylase family protein [Bryobacteraceae bacterium]|nr:alpha-amylase family protein [Bryobacteraceae bacterium]